MGSILNISNHLIFAHLTAYTIALVSQSAYGEPQDTIDQLTIRLVGTHQRMADVEVSINGEVYTADNNGEIPYTSPNSINSIRLISSEYTLYEEEVDFTEDSGIIWVRALAVEATGLYSHRVGAAQVQALNRYEVETAPGSLNDPVRAVQTLPAVGRAPFNSAWLLVRGGRESDTSQSLNGVEVPNILHLGGYYTAIHPLFVELSTITPSGLSAELGRAVSGNLNLKTRDLDGSQAAEAGVDIINGHMFMTTPAPGGAAAFSIRRSWLRYALANLSGLGDQGSRIAPSFFDANARWEGDNVDVHAVSLSDNIDIPTSDSEVVTAKMDSMFVVGRWSDAINTDNWSVDLRGRASSHQLALEGDEATKAQSINSLALHGIASYRHNRNLSFRMGLDSELEQATISLSPVSVTRGRLSSEPWSEVSLGTTNFLTAGLRYSNFLTTNQFLRGGLSPRVQLGKTFGETTVRGYISRLLQPPDIVYLTSYPEGHDLALEASNEVGAGLDWEGQSLAVSSSMYLRSMPTFTLLESDGTIGQGEAFAVGAETAIKVDLGSVRIDLSGAAMRSQQREEPQDEWLDSHLHHPLELRGVVRWALGNNWTLSGQAYFASGAKWDTNIPTATDLTNDETLSLSSVVDDDGWLPNSHSIDIKISRSKTFKDWHMSLYLDLQNVTNHRGPELIISGFEATNGYGIGMPFLPVLGLSGRILPKED